MRTCYKIVDRIENECYFYTMGVNKSRKTPIGTWLKTDVKVRDGSGGRYYESVFHIFKNAGDTIDYMKHFKALVSVNCKGISKNLNQLLSFAKRSNF